MFHVYVLFEEFLCKLHDKLITLKKKFSLKLVEKVVFYLLHFSQIIAVNAILQFWNTKLFIPHSTKTTKNKTNQIDKQKYIIEKVIYTAWQYRIFILLAGFKHKLQLVIFVNIQKFLALKFTIYCQNSLKVGFDCFWIKAVLVFYCASV